MTRAQLVRGTALLTAVLTLTACQQRMAHPPQYRPLTESEFFPDKQSSRPLEDGVVHRGQILDDDPLASGLTELGKQPQAVTILNEDGSPKATRTGPGIPNKVANFVTTYPFQMTAADLQRGKERYTIYCVPCHSPVGDGRGKIVERGFLPPPNFHTDASRGFSFYLPQNAPRLKDVPAGYIFEIITRGYGGMPDYSMQVSIPDRWRIAAYVKALTYSQNVDPAKLPAGGKNQPEGQGGKK